MLNFPQSTEVKRPLPKAQLYKRFDWEPSQCESFDDNVSRLDFVNWISPRTLPAIAEGAEVKEIFVVEVTLKSRDFDIKNIALIGKSIPQHIVYLLRHDNEAMLAVYHSKLIISSRQSFDGMVLTLNGLNLDTVWQNIVSSIGQFSVKQGNSLTEQIQADEQQAKIERQIAILERQMNATKQPRRKRDLFIQIKLLKKRTL